MALEVEPIPDKNYSKGILVLNFIKYNGRRVQLITTIASPLEMVLRFHSSECYPSEKGKS